MLRYFHSLLLILASTAFAAEEGDILELPSDQLNDALSQMPMPEMGKGRIAKILDRYYNEGLGGPESWGRVESLNVSGILSVEGGDLAMTAYQKKPNLLKMIISRSNTKRNMVLAYDGEVAWYQLGTNAKAEPMLVEEARRFIHNAPFGNHLLYPFSEGKTIRYIDAVPVEGTVCHQIRVTLDTEFQVDYFIDVRSYIEIKVESTDLLNDTQTSTFFKDYIYEFGVPIAKRVESYVQGEWDSTLILDEVKVNSGVMPWMFEMPD